ncbi:DUF397 domain-containing protein [Micromonospora sp. DPT]|uniref:DUF397 domain-containing protein n=1 Tax=Micromonospora sp. DPT TaxID=3142975 RepID=UPI003207FEF5
MPQQAATASRWPATLPASAVRDSKDPDGPALTFAPQAWSALTAATQIRSLTDRSWLS